ncbi:MAG: hypothetical protein ABH851_05780 [Methanobacteriota archaeon]
MGKTKQLAQGEESIPISAQDLAQLVEDAAALDAGGPRAQSVRSRQSDEVQSAFDRRVSGVGSYLDQFLPRDEKLGILLGRGDMSIFLHETQIPQPSETGNPHKQIRLNISLLDGKPHGEIVFGEEPITARQLCEATDLTFTEMRDQVRSRKRSEYKNLVSKVEPRA